MSIFNTQTIWKGDVGRGTVSYKEYKRDFEITKADGLPILGSSAPDFRGDGKKYNPEELLISAISSCHMLWYLHFCSVKGIRVEKYIDNAQGELRINKGGIGKIEWVKLNPEVTIFGSSSNELANELHKKAGKFCFIANSVNFEVIINAKIINI